MHCDIAIERRQLETGEVMRTEEKLRETKEMPSVRTSLSVLSSDINGRFITLFAMSHGSTSPYRNKHSFHPIQSFSLSME